MDQYLIALGSNLGSRELTIARAIALIEEQVGKILIVSQLYETEPIGNADQQFLNGALVCQSRITSPFAVLATLLAIEKSLGRTRETYWGNRTIDLDIVLWRREDGKYPRIDTPELVLPHPRCTERDFVLVPACEIAGNWQYPESGQCLSGYLSLLKTHTIQKKWGPHGPPPKMQNI